MKRPKRKIVWLLQTDDDDGAGSSVYASEIGAVRAAVKFLHAPHVARHFTREKRAEVERLFRARSVAEALAEWNDQTAGVMFVSIYSQPVQD